MQPRQESKDDCPDNAAKCRNECICLQEEGEIDIDKEDDGQRVQNLIQGHFEAISHVILRRPVFQVGDHEQDVDEDVNRG